MKVASSSKTAAFNTALHGVISKKTGNWLFYSWYKNMVVRTCVCVSPVTSRKLLVHFNINWSLEWMSGEPKLVHIGLVASVSGKTLRAQTDSSPFHQLQVIFELSRSPRLLTFAILQRLMPLMQFEQNVAVTTSSSAMWRRVVWWTS